MSGLDDAGNITDPTEWLELNPHAPQWLRDIVATLVDDRLPVVTKTRDSEGWRRVRAGKGKLQMSLILDDRGGKMCLLDNWITPEQVPNLIAALQAAVREIAE